MLKVYFRVIDEVVLFNMEVDFLNCVIFGEDVKFGILEFDFFIKEVCKEMMVKCG